MRKGFCCVVLTELVDRPNSQTAGVMFMTSSASHKHDISLSCLNMTIHLCTKSRKSHEEIIFPSGEQQYNWPVRSPDLNPIQQRWEVET